MPQRLTVPMSEVRRITVPMSEIQRIQGGGDSQSVQPSPPAKPYQSPRHEPIPVLGRKPAAVATHEFAREFSDRTADVVTGLGLAEPLLAIPDIANDIRGLFKRDTPEEAARLRAQAETRANREKNTPATMNDAYPFTTARNFKDVAVAIPQIAWQGAKGGVNAGVTSARGAGALVSDKVSIPTPEEFQTAAQGAGEFAAALPLYAAATKIPAGVRGLKASYNTLTPVQMDAALGSISRSGIKAKGTSPYTVGRESRQGLKQAYSEFDIDPATIPDASRSMTVNELVIGGTEEQLAKVNAVLQAEHEAAVASGKLPPTAQFIPEESITHAVADRMVDIYHRPISNAVDRFARVKRPDVKRAVYNHLMKRASEEAAGNPALSEAIRNTARQVAATSDEVSALYALKVKANKMPSRRYSGTPSQQIASDVLTSEAQAELADSIRRYLYPAIENIGKLNGEPMAGKLIAAGRRESAAIAMRDGIYNEWTKGAFGQSTADLESWWHHTIRGHSESVPVLGTPFRRASAANAVMRGISGVEKPMRDFNSLLRRGIGPMEGFVPETAIVAPDMQKSLSVLDESVLSNIDKAKPSKDLGGGITVPKPRPKK